MNSTIQTYTQRLNAFKDEVSKEEFHIKQHDKAIDNSLSAQGLKDEHTLMNDKHKLQREEFERLKIVYHQLNLLMHTFEKGMHKISQ